MWADAQRDGRPTAGLPPLRSSVTPFFVACRKFWLIPAARVPCTNAANIGERKTWTEEEEEEEKKKEEEEKEKEKGES